MANTFEEMIASCDIFAGCGGVEVLPSDWRDADGQLKKLVVFGYGSVIWKPGIEFEESQVGYIDGFVRRMWQGNETHRGRKGRPGRVATLIPKPNKRTFGKAFILESKEQIAAAMDHLIMREISLGGYCLGFTPFHRLDLASRSSSLSSSYSSLSSTSSSSSIVDDAISGVPALVFSATTENEYYLGPEKMLSMAKTIANAEGPSGHNIEYLVKICDFMRELPPDIDDNHLLRLEKLTLQYMAERGINYRPLAYPELFKKEDKENPIHASVSSSTRPPNPPPPPLVHGTKRHGTTIEASQLSSQAKLDQESDDMRKDSNPSSNPKMHWAKGRKKTFNASRRQRRHHLNLFFYAPEK